MQGSSSRRDERLIAVEQTTRTPIMSISPLSYPNFTSRARKATAALMLLVGACDEGAPQPFDDRQAGECMSIPQTEEPTEAETLAYSKQLVISDGLNAVTLLVASNNEALLERYDEDMYEIVPLFERPTHAAADKEDEQYETTDLPQDLSNSVLVEERAVRLEDGAIGYELRTLRSAFRHAIQTCSEPNKYTSSADFAEITPTWGPCMEAKISTRMYSWSWYVEKAHSTNLCPGVTLQGGKSNTNRVKLQTCPSLGFNFAFYN